MTTADIHPDDYAAAIKSLNKYEGDVYGLGLNESRARIVLAAVLPAHDQRLRAEVLTEAADKIPDAVTLYVMGTTYREWLRAWAGNEAGQPDKNDGDHGGLVGRDGSRSPSSPHRAGNGDNDE